MVILMITHYMKLKENQITTVYLKLLNLLDNKMATKTYYDCQYQANVNASELVKLEKKWNPLKEQLFTILQNTPIPAPTYKINGSKVSVYLPLRQMYIVEITDETAKARNYSCKDKILTINFNKTPTNPTIKLQKYGNEVIAIRESI